MSPFYRRSVGQVGVGQRLTRRVEQPSPRRRATTTRAPAAPGAYRSRNAIPASAGTALSSTERGGGLEGIRTRMRGLDLFTPCDVPVGQSARVTPVCQARP